MMSARALTYTPPPGPARLERITATTWLDRSSATGVRCRLLLARDPLAPGETLRQVEADMLGLASGLGLGLAHEEPRFLGPVLSMRQGATTVGPLHRERVLYTPRRAIILLDYGHPTCVLRVPDGNPAWAYEAANLSQVHIAVGLDPAGVESGDDAASYARHAASIGRLWTGIASVRT
jgi:hypothetical protein